MKWHVLLQSIIFCALYLSVYQNDSQVSLYSISGDGLFTDKNFKNTFWKGSSKVHFCEIILKSEVSEKKNF